MRDSNKRRQRNVLLEEEDSEQFCPRLTAFDRICPRLTAFDRVCPDKFIYKVLVSRKVGYCSL